MSPGYQGNAKTTKKAKRHHLQPTSHAIWLGYNLQPPRTVSSWSYWGSPVALDHSLVVLLIFDLHYSQLLNQA